MADAIIFMTGLHREDISESVDEAALRFTGAFDNEAETVEARFVQADGREEDYGNAAYKTRIVTVSREDPGTNNPPYKIMDIYGMDWRDTLVGPLQDKRPITHLLSTFAILAINAPRLLFSRQRSSGSSEKWQVRFGWFAYFLLFVYFLMILGAVSGTIAEFAQESNDNTTAALMRQPDRTAPLSTLSSSIKSTTSESSLNNPNTTDVQPLSDVEQPAAAKTPIHQNQDYLDNKVLVSQAEIIAKEARDYAALLANWMLPSTQFMQGVVVWITALGLFLKIDMKTWIQRTGLGITSASQYLLFGSRRQSLQSQLGALLNHIGEKDKYDRIHIVSYSFGSIIAIDSLFATDEPPEVLKRVDSLVTIGCPFDFIRTYWPRYFTDRTDKLGNTRWINIYSAADVLASDFLEYPPTPWIWSRKDGGKSQPITTGINLSNGDTMRPEVNISYGRRMKLDEYPVIEKLAFIGFAMHKQYWEGASPGCYHNIVKELFAGTHALS